MTVELPITEVSHSCGCHDDNELPVIDAIAIPHKIRHAAVLGVAMSMGAGESFVIRAPHLPRPLLAQISAIPGEWEYEVLVDGPEAWDVKVTRTSV
ncbi:MAG: DUF2249 domain-containing protein [Actinomycetaceae bacterium]|nr:DUF2249 domain-containing protein [Actinomycetaceae bacterium]